MPGNSVLFAPEASLPHGLSESDLADYSEIHWATTLYSFFEVTMRRHQLTITTPKATPNNSIRHYSR